jgi:hypothetical protein
VRENVCVSEAQIVWSDGRREEVCEECILSWERPYSWFYEGDEPSSRQQTGRLCERGE